MKRLKKALTLILVILTVTALLPLSVLAAGEGETERAAHFVATVSKMQTCSTLVERETVYIEATAEGVYFDDESYEGVTEALLVLEEVRLAVETSVAFVNAAEGLAAAEEEGYVTLRALLDEAGGYYDKLTDKSYTGVAGAYESYAAILSALVVRERYTEEIIDLAEMLALAETYSEMEGVIRELEDGMQNESFIADHPSAEGILAAISEARSLMKDAIVRANAFIRAVDEIKKGEDFFETLLTAKDALAGVDTTVNGASLAKRSYTELLRDYNEGAARLNSTFE